MIQGRARIMDPSMDAGPVTGLRAEFEVRRGPFVLSAGLRVAPGEVLGVVGPNGSGKSTLLALLSGLLRPDRGAVELNGRTLVDTESGVYLPAHRRTVGLLAQDPLLFPHLSVLANVAFGSRSRGMPRRAAHAQAKRWLSEVDAAGFADRRPGGLSGGQAQRVALARALATDPALLLLDEPFAALDVDAVPVLRGVVRRMLRHAPTGNRPAILVTHDPLDALVLADRLMVLAGGRIVEQGDTRDLLARPRTTFTARIAGLNLVSGVACARGLRTADGSVIHGQHSGPISGDRAAVAVFPPAAVALFTERPNDRPGNVFPAAVAGIEPRGDVIRLRMTAAPGGPPWIADQAVDLTAAAAADLEVEPGTPVWVAIDVAEVAVHLVP